MFKLTITKTALKCLKKTPERTARHIRNALDRLAENPDRTDLDIRPLQGRPGFRMRIGTYRVIYERDEEIRIISVLAIAPRGDIY